MILEHNGNLVYIISSMSQDVLAKDRMPNPRDVWGRASCSARILGGDQEEMDRIAKNYRKTAGDLAEWFYYLPAHRVFWGQDIYQEIEDLGLVYRTPEHKVASEYAEYHKQLCHFVWRSSHAGIIPKDFAQRVTDSLADFSDPMWLENKLLHGESIPPYASAASPWDMAIKSAMTPA